MHIEVQEALPRAIQDSLPALETYNALHLIDPILNTLFVEGMDEKKVESYRTRIEPKIKEKLKNHFPGPNSVIMRKTDPDGTDHWLLLLGEAHIQDKKAHELQLDIESKFTTRIYEGARLPAIVANTIGGLAHLYLRGTFEPRSWKSVYPSRIPERNYESLIIAHAEQVAEHEKKVGKILSAQEIESLERTGARGEKLRTFGAILETFYKRSLYGVSVVNQETSFEDFKASAIAIVAGLAREKRGTMVKLPVLNDGPTYSEIQNIPLEKPDTLINAGVLISGGLTFVGIKALKIGLIFAGIAATHQNFLPLLIVGAIGLPLLYLKHPNGLRKFLTERAETKVSIFDKLIDPIKKGRDWVMAKTLVDHPNTEAGKESKDHTALVHVGAAHLKGIVSILENNGWKIASPSV